MPEGKEKTNKTFKAVDPRKAPGRPRDPAGRQSLEARGRNRCRGEHQGGGKQRGHFLDMGMSERSNNKHNREAKFGKERRQNRPRREQGRGGKEGGRKEKEEK